MPIKLTPKTKRNISRIIPFGIIWLATGWVFLITEQILTRNQNFNPETDVTVTLPVFIFASIAITILGLIIGTIEMLFIEKKFRNYSLKAKMGFKFGIYLILFLLVIVVTFPIAEGLESGLSPLNQEVMSKLGRFFISLTFVNTIFQLSVSLFASLIYSAVSENLGHNVFVSLITGRYHKPAVEKRIFMFLDMKSSTTIAESLGHVRYFELLREYYDLMSDPIINSYGEVYQYIGDEIVVSWKLEKGLANALCIKCFFEIQNQLAKTQEHFNNTYGEEVGFKAGFHLGEVTIGEIGVLKKEIVFTGDVLNTTSRIQNQCGALQSDLLISGKLKDNLNSNEFVFESKGVIELRGRDQREELFAVDRNNQQASILPI